MSKDFLKVKNGLTFPGLTADPADAQNGDFWYRSDLQKWFLKSSSITNELTVGGSGGGIQKIDLVDAVVTTLPTGASATIDGVSVTNNMMVLFTNLSSGANKVYKASGVGSSISWTVQTIFAQSATPTSGDLIWVKQGSVFGNYVLIFTTAWYDFTQVINVFDDGIIVSPRTLPGSPVNGMVVVDSADNKLKKWNGSSWVDLEATGSALPTFNNDIVIISDNSGNLTSSSVTVAELNALSGYTGSLSTDIPALQSAVAKLEDDSGTIAHEDNFSGTGTYSGSGYIISNDGIKGTSVFIQHHATNTKTFSSYFALPRKYRNRNLTVKVDVQSSATTGNLTFKVENQSAQISTTQTITTGNTTFTANTNALGTLITGVSASVINSLKLGALVTGPSAISGSRITALDPVAGTITTDLGVVGSATGAIFKVSNITTQYQWSFTPPYNSNSLTYTFTALPEAGTPQTIIDNISFELTEMSNVTTSVTVPSISMDDCRYSGAGLLTTTGTLRFNASNFTRSFTNIMSYDQSTGRFTANADCYVEGGVTLDIATAAVTFDMNINGTFVQRSNTTPNSTNYKATLAFGVKLNKGDYITFSTASTMTNSTTDSFTMVAQSYSNTTTTLPLTSSVLSTQSDSYLRITGFTASANGSTATKIATLTSGTIQQNIGSDIQYLDDSVNGARFIAQSEGIYRFQYSGDANTTGNGVGFSLNSNNLTTSFELCPISEKIALAYDSGAAGISSVFGEAYLRVGDIIRIHRVGAQANSDTQYTSFTASKIGSTKILNPSSDQKIAIPIHELRFEGATARGSTNTVVVKFNTMSKITGDAWTVNNTASSGTEVTMKKAGRLTVSTCLYLPASGQAWITKNKAVLTATPPADSENFGSLYSTAANMGTVSHNIDVVVGDVIRICANVNPNNELNLFSLTLQETSIAVALQNVAPTYDNSDSAVRVTVGAGFGSTNTNIRRFANTPENFGGDITYTDSATLGGYFTINTTGLYSGSYTEQNTGANNPTIFILKNSTSSVVSPFSLGSATIANQAGNNATASFSNVYLQKGDIIRAYADVPAAISSSSQYACFTIGRVGKTSGTVDVTPFVNIKQVSQIVGEIIAFAGSSAPNNHLVCDGSAISRNTYATLFNVIGTTYGSGDGSTTFNLPDLRGIFLRGAGTQTFGSVTYSATLGVKQNDQMQGHWHNITRSDSVNTSGANITNGGGAASADTYVKNPVTDGVNGTPRTGAETRPANLAVNYCIRFAEDQSGILTQTQQISSDTMSFVFKSTAIDPNTDPIGTYNTYAKNASANVATVLNTTAPSQTTSSMNSNGILLTGYGFTSASTTATPSRFDIFIGKGLSSRQVDCFFGTSKTLPDTFDYKQANSASAYTGCTQKYDPVKGILTLEVEVPYGSITSITSGTQGNCYFTFSASKTPSLVTIPNLQQRVAFLKDVKAGGNTTGGASTAGVYQTRVLNTLEDPTGVVTSLTSNQFTLPAGQYLVEASAPCYAGNAHKIRVRNITDSSNAIVGVKEYNSAAAGVQTNSNASGIVTITSSKVFEIQHWIATANATEGLGVSNPSGGDDNVFTQVKITKIK